MLEKLKWKCKWVLFKDDFHSVVVLHRVCLPVCCESCDGLDSKYDGYQLDYRYPHLVKTFIRHSIDNEMVVMGLGTQSGCKEWMGYH